VHHIVTSKDALFPDKKSSNIPVTFFSAAFSWFWAYRGFVPGNGNFDAFSSCLILGLYKQEFGCRGGSNIGQEAGQNQQEQEAPAAGDGGRHAPTTLTKTQGVGGRQECFKWSWAAN
jgi:hypothetical protein